MSLDSKVLSRQCLFVIACSIVFIAYNILGQPAPYVAPPDEIDVRRLLLQKIEGESNGRLALHALQTKVETPKENKTGPCSVYFYAEVSFKQPGIWYFKEKGDPLSFKTTDLFNRQESVTTNFQDKVEATRRGQGFNFSGDITFRRRTNFWSATETKVRFYPKQNERMDFALISCTGNLREIASSLRVWAMKHDGSFAFGLSTNAGGTKEFSAVDVNGFDQYPEIHFRAMASGSLDPRYLVCPADLRKAATGIASLQETNISYRLRTEPSVALNNSKEILCKCPIHGVAINCDGRLNYLKPPTN